MGAILLLIEFAASEGWKVTCSLFVLLFINPHLDPLGFCVTVGSIVVYWLSQWIFHLLRWLVDYVVFVCTVLFDFEKNLHETACEGSKPI